MNRALRYLLLFVVVMWVAAPDVSAYAPWSGTGGLLNLQQQTGAPTFVYQPGGTATGNVYTTWASLYAALNAVQGDRWVEVDDSVTSPAVIPAGTYNLNHVTLTTRASFTNANGGAVLSIANAVQLSFDQLTIGPWLWVTYANANPVVTVNASTECNVIMRPFSAINSTAGAFFDVKSGGFLWMHVQNASVGDQTHPVFNIESGGAGQWNGSQGEIHANAFTGAGTAAFLVFVDDQGNAEAPQGGVTVYPTHHVGVKTSDQSNATTLLATESQLLVQMGPSDLWYVRWRLYVTWATASAGIGLSVSVPTGATVTYTLSGMSTGGSNVVSNALESTSAATRQQLTFAGSSATAAIVDVTAMVQGDGTHAGNITLQFSETDSSTNATIKAGSGVFAQVAGT